MQFENIEYSVHERIGSVTLNRPATLNALTAEMRRELVEAPKAAEADDSVSLVLIQGAGRAFCAGYAMSGSGGTSTAEVQSAAWTGEFARGVLRDFFVIWDLLKPVVAKVHGYCLAGGADLISMCDIVFVADDAVIGHPPLRAQSTPDVAFFPWKMSMAQAKYLQLTGNSISGKRAAEIGWVAKSFPAETFDSEVMRELRPMSQIHPALLTANKLVLNQTYEAMGLRAAMQASIPWHVLARHLRPGAGEFQRIAASDGLKAALQWRDGAFKAEGFPL